jgi:hypothetical protein
MAKVCVGCIPFQDTCLPSDGGAMICDNNLHKCIPKPDGYLCHNDSECSGITTVCQHDMGLCVQCLVPEDCADVIDHTTGFLTPICNAEDVAYALGIPPDYLCHDGCYICRGSRPICARDMGMCCAQGGACARGVPPQDLGTD